jgi:hypothetical protein
MNKNLKLYECCRWNFECYEDWKGALLILAEDENQARNIFAEKEYGKQPLMVEEIVDIIGSGEARVVYEDELR